MKYPVDLHMHTLASSHAYSTIYEYITTANKARLDMIAITDHGPALADSPHPWHFLNLRAVPRQVEGLRILRGIEANILNENADLDCDDPLYDNLDFCIAGFHEPVISSFGIEINTKIMINVIKKPKVSIISHPGNPRFPVYAQAIADAAKEFNVALEVNNSSYLARPGSEKNCKDIIRAIKSVDGYISLGSDSHIAFTVGSFDNCQILIDECGFPVKNIINTSWRNTLEFLSLKQDSKIKELFNK